RLTRRRIGEYIRLGRQPINLLNKPMANHKLEIKSWGRHSKSQEPTSNQMWNINNIHDFRAQLRHQVGLHSKKGNRFICYHNGKEVYNSENPTPGCLYPFKPPVK